MILVAIATFIVGDMVFGGKTTFYGWLTWATSSWVLVFLLIGTSLVHIILTVWAWARRKRIANSSPWQYRK